MGKFLDVFISGNKDQTITLKTNEPLTENVNNAYWLRPKFHFQDLEEN